MKTNSVKPGNLRRHLGRLVSASVLGLLGLTALGQAAPKSPVGTWDCVMSGPREGLAVISFYADHTFTNYEVLVPKPPKLRLDNDSRNGDGGGRFPGDGSGGATDSPPLPPQTQIFGGQETSGLWGFDSRGRVIGSFYEISQPMYFTNMMPTLTNVDSTLYVSPHTNGSLLGDEYCVTVTVATNLDLGTYTNLTTCFAISALAITNQFSFVGTVVPGKRMTLVASSPAGKVTFSGVPDVPLADLSGDWYGTERVGQLWYTEFFTLSPTSAGNVYNVAGSGPGYYYSGKAIQCPQKKIALELGMYPIFGGALLTTPQEVRAVVGPLNMKRLGGALHGLQGSGVGNGSATNTVSPSHRLSFSIQHQ